MTSKAGRLRTDSFDDALGAPLLVADGFPELVSLQVARRFNPKEPAGIEPVQLSKAD